MNHTFITGHFTLTLTLTSFCLADTPIQYEIDFSANTTDGFVPLTVLFTDTSTVPGEVISRFWDFGDGTYVPGPGLSIIHIYTSPGQYSVRMDRTDDEGVHSRIKFDYITADVLPTTGPTTLPTTIPTTSPTTIPTTSPTTLPTTVPTTSPTSQPTTIPTTAPTTSPTTIPTTSPTTSPTTIPTTSPTTVPTTGTSRPPAEFWGLSRCPGSLHRPGVSSREQSAGMNGAGSSRRHRASMAGVVRSTIACGFMRPIKTCQQGFPLSGLLSTGLMPTRLQCSWKGAVHT